MATIRKWGSTEKSGSTHPGEMILITLSITIRKDGR
jgi:hypothetical protein